MFSITDVHARSGARDNDIKRKPVPPCEHLISESCSSLCGLDFQGDFYASACCSVRVSSDNHQVSLIHGATGESQQAFCKKSIQTAGPVVHAFLSSDTPGSVLGSNSVVLVLCNGSLLFWRYVKASSRSPDSWILDQEMSLLQWQHNGAQIIAIAASPDFTNILWCEQYSQSGSEVRDICSIRLDWIGHQRVLRDVTVLVTKSPRCQLHNIGQNFCCWFEPPAPSDFYFMWCPLSQSLETRILLSPWRHSERRRELEPFCFLKLATRGRMVWAQRYSIPYKVFSMDHSALYLLHPDGALLSIDSHGNCIHSKQLPLFPDMKESWQHVVVCGKLNVVCVGLGHTIHFYSLETGTHLDSVLTPVGEEIKHLQPVRSQLFLVLVITARTAHLLKMEKPADRKTITAKDELSSDLHHMMSALYKHPSSELITAETLRSLMKSQPDEFLLKQVLGEQLDLYLKLDERKQSSL